MIEYDPVVRDGKPADAAVVYCIDPDFQPAFHKAIESFGFKKYVPFPRAGASKAVVENPSVMDDIKESHGLHQFPLVVILDHIDCKKYGVNDETEETAKHEEYLQLAVDGLKKAIPELEVEAHLLGWKGEIPTNTNTSN